MSKHYFMGIDIGSFETKGVIIDEQCSVVISRAVKHDMENPYPLFFEHDAEKVWWHDFCKISNSLLEESGIENTQIACVGASTLGADCLPVDRECRPLRKAILYGIDCRASKEIAFLNTNTEKKYLDRLDGIQFNSSDIPPKILWIKNNEPEIYEKAYKFLSGSCYIAAKLTGKYTLDRYMAMAGYAPLYKIDGSIDETASKMICRADQLPECYATTDIIGHVTKEAAEATGLMQGTPVIAGTDDAIAESISTGILNAGDMVLVMGSTLCLECLSDHVIKDEHIISREFVIPGYSSIGGATNAAGTLTRWFRDQIYFDAIGKQESTGKDAYAVMMEDAKDIPAGSEGLIMLPYIAGERTPINDPIAKGLIIGLGLHHTRRHMYKAALEAVGYTIGQYLEILNENGVQVKNITAAGGGTKNPLWLQIIADITNRTIKTTQVTIGASYGDAMMAGIGVGVFKDFSDLTRHMKLGNVYVPNAENHEIYKRYQKIYNQLYQANKEFMHQL